MIMRRSTLPLLAFMSACSGSPSSRETTGGGSQGTFVGGGSSKGGTFSGSGGELFSGGTAGSNTMLSAAGQPTGGTPSNSSAQETTVGSGGTSTVGGETGAGGATIAGGTGGKTGAGGATTAGGTGGTTGSGGATLTGGTGGATSVGGATACSQTGPVGTISGALADGVNFLDTDGNRVNAHGGGIIQVGDTFYMHGEVFESGTTDNNFKGFSMYSSRDMATWKNEGIILPQQASGELGPNRKGERPHIIKCPSTGEFVLYAHAASQDYQTDKEVVYATSATVNGQYSYRGPIKNASGALAVHSDMSAYADATGAYVIAESGRVYTLAADCHSWLSYQNFPAVNGPSTGVESPTVFKAGSTYYWIGSYKTGWRANNNFYSTAPAVTGPWTYRGYLAPVTDTANNISAERTWLSQSTWVQPVTGCNGTVYVYWGDHWYGTTDTSAPGRYNYLATYVFQPLVFNGINISLPTYKETWKIDVGAGTWSL